MKKIMFSDKFGLTKAVLEGRKTMTRRIVPGYDGKTIPYGGIDGTKHFVIANNDRFFASVYAIGDVVAVAQNYKDAGFSPDTLIREYKTMKDVPGWTNKMFVEAQSMLYFIRITNIKVERLQDITRGDIEKEGIQWSHKAHRYYTCFNPITATYLWLKGSTPEEAFAALIDKVSGKGTWKANPWVFVYEFELVK